MSLKNYNNNNPIKNSSNTYYQTAMNNYYNKNYADAVKYFTLALNNNEKEYSGLYSFRAYSKSNLGDILGAIEDYDIVIKNNYYSSSFSKAVVLNNKAYCLVELKRYKEALPLANEAIRLNEKYDFIWDTRGELNYKLGFYNQCVIDMSNVIKINPNGNAYYYRGLAKIKLKNKKEGCKDLSKAGMLGKSEAYIEIKKYCN